MCTMARVIILLRLLTLASAGRLHSRLGTDTLPTGGMQLHAPDASVRPRWWPAGGEQLHTTDASVKKESRPFSYLPIESHNQPFDRERFLQMPRATHLHNRVDAIGSRSLDLDSSQPWRSLDLDIPFLDIPEEESDADLETAPVPSDQQKIRPRAASWPSLPSFPCIGHPSHPAMVSRGWSAEDGHGGAWQWSAEDARSFPLDTPGSPDELQPDAEAEASGPPDATVALWRKSLREQEKHFAGQLQAVKESSKMLMDPCYRVNVIVEDLNLKVETLLKALALDIEEADANAHQELSTLKEEIQQKLEEDNQTLKYQCTTGDASLNHPKAILGCEWIGATHPAQPPRCRRKESKSKGWSSRRSSKEEITSR